MNRFLLELLISQVMFIIMVVSWAAAYLLFRILQERWAPHIEFFFLFVPMIGCAIIGLAATLQLLKSISLLAHMVPY